MRIERKIVGLISLAWLSGCGTLVPKTPEINLTKGKDYNPPDLNLTLIHKEMPERNFDYFSRAELSFSTNKTQKTHATLSRPLNEKVANQIRSIPIGTTMKESEWDNLLFSRPKGETKKFLRMGNWIRFY